MARRRMVALRLGVALLLFAIAAYLTRSLWLGALGRALVEDDGPAKADAVVVLGGDVWGTRIETAARLVRLGYAPVVLIDGEPVAYDVSEADLAIPYIVRQGYPAEWFVALRNQAMSTREESFLLLRELRRRQVRSLILVTSDFHTARAGPLLQRRRLVAEPRRPQDRAGRMGKNHRLCAGHLRLHEVVARLARAPSGAARPAEPRFVSAFSCRALAHPGPIKSIACWFVRTSCQEIHRYPLRPSGI